MLILLERPEKCSVIAQKVDRRLGRSLARLKDRKKDKVGSTGLLGKNEILALSVLLADWSPPMPLSNVTVCPPIPFPSCTHCNDYGNVMARFRQHSICSRLRSNPAGFEYCAFLASFCQSS